MGWSPAAASQAHGGSPSRPTARPPPGNPPDTPHHAPLPGRLRQWPCNRRGRDVDHIDDVLDSNPQTAATRLEPGDERRRAAHSNRGAAPEGKDGDAPAMTPTQSGRQRPDRTLLRAAACRPSRPPVHCSAPTSVAPAHPCALSPRYRIAEDGAAIDAAHAREQIGQTRRRRAGCFCSAPAFRKSHGSSSWLPDRTNLNSAEQLADARLGT
jgi:hypothetical protein